MGTVCNFLIGSTSKGFVSKYSFLKNRQGFGSGSEKPVGYWKALGKKSSLSILYVMIVTVNLIAAPLRIF